MTAIKPQFVIWHKFWVILFLNPGLLDQLLWQKHTTSCPLCLWQCFIFETSRKWIMAFPSKQRWYLPRCKFFRKIFKKSTFSVLVDVCEIILFFFFTNIMSGETHNKNWETQILTSSKMVKWLTESDTGQSLQSIVIFVP